MIFIKLGTDLIGQEGVAKPGEALVRVRIYLLLVFVISILVACVNTSLN